MGHDQLVHAYSCASSRLGNSMEYPDNVIPHPNAAEPPIANERIFAADRTLSDHGQHSLSQAFDAARHHQRNRYARPDHLRQ